MLGALYTVKLSPEMRFWDGIAQIKQAWAGKLSQEYPSKVVVYGGSSCTFSLDGKRALDRFGLPLVNCGLGAGMGSTVLTNWALSQLRRGDTLILALEPGALTEVDDLPAMGVQFAVSMHALAWTEQPWQQTRPGWFNFVDALRPGGTQVFTMLAKCASRAPLFRYSVADCNPSGLEHTQVRLPPGGFPGHGASIPPERRAFLKWLCEWCANHGVRVAYSLPWGYSPREAAQSFRESNIRFLCQLSEFIPILKDPRLGVQEDAEKFADTNWHLTEKAAAERTDEFARQVQQWSVWSPEELATLQRQCNIAGPSDTVRSSP